MGPAVCQGGVLLVLGCWSLVSAFAAPLPAGNLVIKVNTTEDGRLPESALVGAIAQAKASLASVPERSVVVLLPGGEFSVNTTEVPFELSGVRPAITAQLIIKGTTCLLYTSPSPRDQRGSRMPSSA